MSLLQQLVDTIGESIGGAGEYFEEKSTGTDSRNRPLHPAPSEPPKKVDHRDDDSENKFMNEFANIGHSLSNEWTAKSVRSEGPESAASSVSFGKVQVREYERVIDSTNIYMGLALGWNYNDKGLAPIEENQRRGKYATSPTSANHGGEESRMKRTNGSDRYGMLIRYGYAQKELKLATKEAAKFYKQRQREAARSIVVADERTKQNAGAAPKRRPLLRSMFG